AADQLDIVMAHAQGANGRLAHCSESVRQQYIKAVTASMALAQLFGPGFELSVAELLVIGLERVDCLDILVQAFDQPLVTAAHHPGNHGFEHGSSVGRKKWFPRSDLPW